MKFNIQKKTLHNATKLLIFIGLVVSVAYLLPNSDRFKYYFENGKPWSYDLLTAPFDFPIYKSDSQIQTERKEILKGFVPYFQFDTTVVSTQLNRLMVELQSDETLSDVDVNQIKSRWQAVYNSGIMEAEMYQQLITDQVQEIYFILPNNEKGTLSLKEVYTPKTAYQALQKLPMYDLSAFNLHLYLKENLRYDSVITDMSKHELLQDLSITAGIVQAGERIIDRGEIVTDHLYVLLTSLERTYQEKEIVTGKSVLVIVGEGIIITGLLLLFFLYLYLFRPRIFEDNNHLLFIGILILMMMGVVSVVVQFTTAHYFMLPYALLPIIVRVFYDSRTALFAHIITTLILSLMVDNAFQFILIQVVIGMTAVSSLKDMTQRSQLAQTALLIFVAYALTYVSLELIAEGDVAKIFWRPLLYFAISSAILLFAYLLIYIFEKIFGLVSAITLIELTNVNSDLMIQFAEKAPGTFQHTLQVSNLATEAAKKIGANSLLVRTGALYHDIGKMKNPQYFIENQMGSSNPLSSIDFGKAAQIIIGHVNDGIAIAKKARLPEQIIHFIATHHGVGKTKYFYNSFINENPDVQPDESLYTYPGPLPDTKETAILMMADAVEARARSLQVYNETTISECVENMINTQIADGMFREAPISFRDVETVKEIFKDKIRNMYHNRIKYPEVQP